MTNKVYQTTVEYNEDFDEYYITLPEDLLVSTGWEDGDILEWHVNKDGSVFVERVDEYYEESEDADE